jgi:hypothetical protein
MRLRKKRQICAKQKTWILGLHLWAPKVSNLLIFFLEVALTYLLALCVPFEQNDLPENALCTRPSCGKPAINYTQFGRSY